MKRKITQAEFDNLSPELQALYEASGEGYELNLEDDDNNGGGSTVEELQAELDRLKAKKDLAETHRRNAEKRAAELQTQIDDAAAAAAANADNKARKEGDIASLDKSWQERFDKLKSDHEAEVNRLTGHLHNVTIDAKAQEIAARISTVPSLLEPVIRKRLRMDTTEEGVSIRVLDGTGQLSALSIEDLEKEIAGNKDYAQIIIAGKGSGGGSRGGQDRSGASDKPLSEMSEEERIAWHTRDPAGFQKAISTN